jgi:hypothetical protein
MEKVPTDAEALVRASHSSLLEFFARIVDYFFDAGSDPVAS